MTVRPAETPSALPTVPEAQATAASPAVDAAPTGAPPIAEPPRDADPSPADPASAAQEPTPRGALRRAAREGQRWGRHSPWRNWTGADEVQRECFLAASESIEALHLGYLDLEQALRSERRAMDRRYGVPLADVWAEYDADVLRAQVLVYRGEDPADDEQEAPLRAVPDRAAAPHAQDDGATRCPAAAPGGYLRAPGAPTLVLVRPRR
ncbi:MAG: hypothetical protein GXY79_01225 [Chloroflexi bacterium]|nr:hypothetical protein [Chloroflexota bacterium]